MRNSHFEPSDLYNDLQTGIQGQFYPPFIWPGNEPITGFPIAISNHQHMYLYIHTISQQPRIWQKVVLNAVTRNAWIGWDRACQYIALIFYALQTVNQWLKG